MIKWLLIMYAVVKTYLFGKEISFKFDPIVDFKNMIRENSAKLIVLFASISALATIFAAGVVMFFMNIGMQYDANESVKFSSVMSFSLLLALVPTVIMYFGIKSFQEEDKKFQEKLDEIAKSNETHPVQDAIVLLIQDFIKDREEKRSSVTSVVKETTVTEQNVNKDSAA